MNVAVASGLGNLTLTERTLWPSSTTLPVDTGCPNKMVHSNFNICSESQNHRFYFSFGQKYVAQSISLLWGE